MSIKFYRFYSILFFCCVSCGALFLGSLFYIARYPLLDEIRIDRKTISKPSLVLDVAGKEIMRFHEDSRQYVSLISLPSHVAQAFVAAEDWNFFKHPGLSFKGIVRSILVNLYYGKKMQGASTITQQLVKLAFLDNKKTFSRKCKEQLYALLIEQQYTKEQILECYLNTLYFGSGMYGIQNAAQVFWNKNAADLTIEESALLAAIIRSPGNYSPLYYPRSAQKKRDVVLKKMKNLGFISVEDCKKLQNITVIIDRHKKTKDIFNLAIKEYIRGWIEDRYGKDILYTGGLVIQTTFDSALQSVAERVFCKQLKKMRLQYGGDFDGGFVSIDVHTGAIRALVTGFDQKNDYFNRVFYAKRQQGSVFKPVIYAAALASGMSFCDTAVDEPLEVSDNGHMWAPRNHTRVFEGIMTLARALVYSNNIISVKVLLHIGVEKVVELAKKCHLSGSILPYPSLALGCIDSTLIEVIGMFNIFANNGSFVAPYCITSIKDETGKKIYKHTICDERIIDSKITHQVAQVLTLGLETKRMNAAHWIDSEGLSKTGTTNDSRTCWFVGSTPELTTAVYIGCDDNRPMGRSVFPIHTAFPIWLEFHKLVKTKQKKFLFDSSLQSIFIDSKTGEFCSARTNKDIYPLLV